MRALKFFFQKIIDDVIFQSWSRTLLISKPRSQTNAGLSLALGQFCVLGREGIDYSPVF